MKIEQRSLDAVTPYAGNPRRISAAAVAAVAESIRRYGFRQPIVVDAEGVVIVGHTRLQAAKQLGLKTVPVHVADLTPEQAAAYRLGDNRTGELAAWDDQALAAELTALVAASSMDVAAVSEMTAFDTRELDRLLGQSKGQTDPDEVPDPPADPVTTLGDLWVLGQHRLLCGNATSADDVGRLLDGVSPTLMVTDPPYGVRYDPTWRDDCGGTFANATVGMRGSVTNDDVVQWQEAWARFPGDVAYVWHAGIHAADVSQQLASVGFTTRAQIVWRKPHFILSRGHYHWQHEPCWYAVRQGRTAHWVGDRSQSTVWDIAGMNPAGGGGEEKLGHGTQKPVECMERPLRNHEGDVYDPFVGSGTTLIAAERQHRACYALEIDPRYVDMAVARWEAYTGQQGERAS